MCAFGRFVCRVRLYRVPENALRLGRGSRFVTPVISNRSLRSLYFVEDFSEMAMGSGLREIVNEIRKLFLEREIAVRIC